MYLFCVNYQNNLKLYYNNIFSFKIIEWVYCYTHFNLISLEVFIAFFVRTEFDSHDAAGLLQSVQAAAEAQQQEGQGHQVKFHVDVEEQRLPRDNRLLVNSLQFSVTRLQATLNVIYWINEGK